jgi:hypothetical protein
MSSWTTVLHAKLEKQPSIIALYAGPGCGLAQHIRSMVQSAYESFKKEGKEQRQQAPLTSATANGVVMASGSVSALEIVADLLPSSNLYHIPHQKLKSELFDHWLDLVQHRKAEDPRLTIVMEEPPAEVWQWSSLRKLAPNARHYNVTLIFVNPPPKLLTGLDVEYLAMAPNYAPDRLRLSDWNDQPTIPSGDWRLVRSVRFAHDGDQH